MFPFHRPSKPIKLPEHKVESWPWLKERPVYRKIVQLDGYQVIYEAPTAEGIAELEQQDKENHQPSN